MIDHPQSVPPFEARALSLRDLAAVFFRHQNLFLATFAMVFAAGLLYSVLFPSYTAEMKMVVRRGRIDPAVTPAQTGLSQVRENEISEEELNSQSELLRNEDVLREVIIRTGLAERNSLLAHLRREDPASRMARAVQFLQAKLRVQPVRKSQLIKVSYSSADPQLAAGVLKTLATVYLQRETQLQRPSGQQVFFREQVEQTRGSVRAAQDDLIRFTATKNVTSAALERDLTVQKLADMQAEVFRLQALIAESQERARSLDVKLRELPQHRVVQTRSTDNPQLQEKLKSRLLELQLRRTELMTRFQPSYRLVQEVDRQIAQTTSAIQAENLTPLRDEVTEENPDYVWASSQRVGTAVELDALQRRESLARTQLAAYQAKARTLVARAVEQSDLEQRVRVAEERFLLYARKQEESRISDALDEKGILNAVVAQEPQVPALPSRSLWASLGFTFMAALAFSTSAAFIADYVDPSFRTPREVVKTLEVPVLAFLPAEKHQRMLRSS